ncbi:hypothetical protein DUNSADRAFT_544 [Dunaliella salina]|uniref:LisH domain-containing protein n=1 Tax=Dunaliella salina TaxID=3046 RepID=A0ABQ7FYQ9_DUNSA|nr:hypothetical protein DUNSADRAFT_544 [Dunaliella salina]|eukprot:KAF5827505.1 hypothetical protein DUNSADRAFT_544 [Dunaliella salina]
MVNSSGSGGQGASSSQGHFAGATRDGLLDVLGGGQSSSQHPSQVMGDSGAAYIAQLNAVCQFLRQEGFVQAERQLLQELEQKFPSIGKLSPEEEEEAGRQAHHAVQEAHAATVARSDLLASHQHSHYQQHSVGGGLGGQPPFPLPPPLARPQARLRPPHKIPKQKVPWGPDVDEYQSIEDVGYIRKDISGQQQFEELELLGSDLSEEPEGMATASGPLSSHRDDDYEGSSRGHGEGSEEEEEGEDEGEQGSSQGGGDVASLSETEDLGTRHLQQQQRSSSFQSPASSTLELHPSVAAGAPGAHTGSTAGEQGSVDPTWDMGPQDIKLTEPVSTPSKGSGDQQQLSGENSRPVLSRVESLSSSLKDFDADRTHEHGEGMASGTMSRAHSDCEQHPPPEAGGGEVIDFNPIPLAQATPQDLKAFGLHELQQGVGQQQQQQQQQDAAALSAVTSSLAVGVGSRAQHAPLSEDPEAGAAASRGSQGATTPGRESNKSLEQEQGQADAREPGGGFSFPVTPKQSDEPQSHPPPFKSWPSVRSSFTSDLAAASDDDHNAADYADEDYSKSVSASKTGSKAGSRSTAPAGSTSVRPEDAADISNVGPTFYGGALSIGRSSPKSNPPMHIPAPGEQEKAGQPSSTTAGEAEEEDGQSHQERGAQAAEEAAGSKGGPSQAQQAAGQASPIEHSPGIEAEQAGGGSAMPSRSPVMVLAAAASGSPGSDGSNEDATQASPKASESVQSASQLTLAPLPQDESMEGPGGQPEVVAHMVDNYNETSSSSQHAEGDGEGDGATSVLRRQIPRSGSEAGGSEGGPDDTEMREAEAHIADREMQWQQVQLGAGVHNRRHSIT